MKNKISAGDKLTCIRVTEMAMTAISEITVDSITNDRVIYAEKRKRYYLPIDKSMLILKGHNLGITQASWGENGSKTILMDANCNIGGLDRERMIALLQTNINPEYSEWHRIHWFDGTSEEGEAIFSAIPRSIPNRLRRQRLSRRLKTMHLSRSATVTEPTRTRYRGLQLSHSSCDRLIRRELQPTSYYSSILPWNKFWSKQPLIHIQRTFGRWTDCRDDQ